VIEIKQHRLLGDFLEHARITPATRRGKFDQITRLISRSRCGVCVKHGSRQSLNQLGVAGPERLAWRKLELPAIAFAEAEQASFERLSQLPYSELERGGLSTESGDDISPELGKRQPVMQREVRIQRNAWRVRRCQRRVSGAFRRAGRGVIHPTHCKGTPMPAEHSRTTRAQAPRPARWPLMARLLRDGVQAMSDAELIAVLIRKSATGSQAEQTAVHLLDSHRGSLRALAARGFTAGLPLHSTHAVLQAALEFTRRSLLETLRERPLINSPSDLHHFLALWLRERPRECFAALFLDSQNRLICAEEMFAGSVAQTVVYPREIARRALETGACSLIVAHNHPSGVTEPSAADRKLTQALRDALRLLDLPLLDHIIVADNRCFSFAEAGLI